MRKNIRNPFFVGLFLAVICAAPKVRAVTNTVLMSNFSFTPSTLNISVNDSVLWTNTTSTAHEITEDNFTWASPSLAQGQKFTFKFTQAGTFNYYCQPHDAFGMQGQVVVTAANTVPTVNLVSPTNGATYASPATIALTATAKDNDGSITNVQFFNGTTLLGTVTNFVVSNTNFSFTASNLTSGTYNIKAVAKDNGGATNTSSVATISVVTPVNVSLTSQAVSNGLFRFQYPVNPGLTYVVQASSNLSSYVSLQTNVPASSPATFTIPPTNSLRYFRVQRVP